MIKTDTIPNFELRTVIARGLDNITSAYSVFEITYDGHEPSLTKELQDRNYKVTGTRSLPPDFFGSIVEYTKKTESELRNENLELRIKDLEKHFNIKITYTKI